PRLERDIGALGRRTHAVAHRRTADADGVMQEARHLRERVRARRRECRAEPEVVNTLAWQHALAQEVRYVVPQRRIGRIKREDVHGHARLEQRPHVPCEERNSPAWELMSEDGEPQRDDPQTVTVLATPRNADRARSKRGTASPARGAPVTRPGQLSRPAPGAARPPPRLAPGLRSARLEVDPAHNLQ